MNCDPNALLAAARCFSCIPKGKLREVIVYLFCQWENSIPPAPFSDVIVQAPDLSYWRVVVNTAGNVGMQSSPGPVTPPVIMEDGNGVFWRLIVNNAGLRGTQPDPGPASASTRIDDGTSVFWKLIVDTLGNLGAIQTP